VYSLEGVTTNKCFKNHTNGIMAKISFENTDKNSEAGLYITNENRNINPSNRSDFTHSYE